MNPGAEIIVAHTGSFGDTVKAAELAQSQIKAGADVLTGSSQQALGALRAVADYPNEDIWWLGQDLAQLGIPEEYKVIAASSYNYAAVINDMVDLVKSGVLGGKNVPMNFNNNGFIFKYNDTNKGMITPAIEAEVTKALDNFKSQAGHPSVSDWQSVTYN